ncbi:MAG TPA: hypothetical protein VFR31_01825 [Thermoanaerobaculia bacterium]|nr:hypothetical protein [Thermoanaerobaculia bacterium]
MSITFLTGMQRSGTTLLERMLGLLSQPFPLLFVEAKRDFLRSLGRESRYPLGHLFQEEGYEQEDFDRHLAGFQLSRSRLERIFEEMEGFSGQYTRFDRSAVIPENPPGGFAELVAGLYRALGATGGKETICEEFLPGLLDRGWQCVLILRDPRDIIASLNHGRGPEFGGRIKPTLFNIRNWRKSVAYALHLEGRPGFQWLRYEDLVADPRALGFEPGEIRDWTGNSSHGERTGVSAESVGAWRRVLPEPVARFIEATCLPEMRLLGYPADAVLHGFEEPYEITREGVESDLANPENLEIEARRLEILQGPWAGRRWFLFERAQSRLREAM